MKLSSNVTEGQAYEITLLVPDAFSDPDEFWRVVPNTLEGWTYSVSSKRDLLVKHTRKDDRGRTWKCMLIAMSYDEGVYNTSIRRSSKAYSTYITHVRYDAFPELNPETYRTPEEIYVTRPYEGLDWYGRHKDTITYIPVSGLDMEEILSCYPTPLPREVWAYVPGSHKIYAISTQGRGVILEHTRVNGQRLPTQIWQLQSCPHEKYYECCYTVDGYQLNSVSHPHILRSFIPKPTSDHEVNHIDGDTHNNMLDNLEWVTRQENSDHYNYSPEMAYKRAIGYRKISEFGKAHQKEIQNRPEVNVKRSATLKATLKAKFDQLKKEQNENQTNN